MFTVIQSQGSLADLITLDEAKYQCRLMPDFILDDTELTDLKLACCELAQTYTHRLLTEGVVNGESDEYYPEFILPWGNVTAVTEVLLDDEAYTDFTFSPVTQKLKIPDTFSNIKVTYNAGYSALPVKAKKAILMMISTLYNNHDDFIPGLTIQKIPMSSLMLLDSIKLYVV